jgi:sortase A
MKPMNLLVVLVVGLILCAALAFGLGLTNTPTTPPSSRVVAVSPTSNILVVPSAQLPLPPAGGGAVTATPPVQTVPADQQQQLPTTGAWGLPFALERYLPAWLARPPRPAALPPQQAPLVGRLLIPSIAVDAPVVAIEARLGLTPSGDKRLVWDIPDFAAGFHVGSAAPGQAGNTVISGHNNLGSQVFRQLEEVERGAVVTLEMADGTRYDYVVQKVLILPEEGQPESVRLANARYIAPTGDVRLTLVSCWPDWTNSERVVIVATP